SPRAAPAQGASCAFGKDGPSPRPSPHRMVHRMGRGRESPPFALRTILPLSHPATVTGQSWRVGRVTPCAPSLVSGLWLRAQSDAPYHFCLRCGVTEGDRSFIVQTQPSCYVHSG